MRMAFSQAGSVVRQGYTGRIAVARKDSSEVSAIKAAISDRRRRGIKRVKHDIPWLTMQ